MAGGRDYSRTQKKIIDRYYENRDSIMAQKLGEIVSELYLAEGKKAQTPWGRAEKALANLSQNDSRVRKVLEEKNLEGLAKLVNDLG